MSYTYDQRKRPQGQTNAPPARTATAGPVSAPLRADTAGAGDPSALETAMQERMSRTFGDLSAVKNYQPPVKEVSAPPAPHTGPVGHAISASAPSPFMAGVMQAKRDDTDPKRGKAKRKVLMDQTVDETAEGYDQLDPTKWEEREKERGFFARLFNQQRHFYKAKIDRRAWEMTREELQNNRFNPNNVSDLTDIQKNITTAGSNMTARAEEGVPQEVAQNGFNNRSAWLTFQNYSGASEDDTLTFNSRGKSWDMNEVDHTAFTNKLKNISRMVRDYPELKGHIGSLISIDQKERDKKKEEKKNKQALVSNGQGNVKPKKLRQRLKRKKGTAPVKMQPAPMEGYQPNLGWQQDDITDPGWKEEPNKNEDEDKGGTMVMAAGFVNSYSSGRGHQLQLNAGLEGSSNEARKKRRDVNEELTKRYGTTLDYAANHELGHMLNYELIKELNRNKGTKEKSRHQLNKEDARYHITANRLVEQALKDTMDPEDFKKLVRYEEDSLGEDEEWDPGVQLGEDEEWVTKDTDERFKKGQINLKASGLGATKNNRGYTTDYGATNAAEFFAEAFADVYQNGKDARPASIRLVQLYEEEMKNAQKANES